MVGIFVLVLVVLTASARLTTGFWWGDGATYLGPLVFHPWMRGVSRSEGFEMMGLFDLKCTSLSTCLNLP